MPGGRAAGLKRRPGTCKAGSYSAKLLVRGMACHGHLSRRRTAELTQTPAGEGEASPAPGVPVDSAEEVPRPPLTGWPGSTAVALRLRQARRRTSCTHF